MVDDEDCSAGEICEPAEIEEDGLNRGNAVLCRVHQVGEGIDDDESDAEIDGAIGERPGVRGAAKVVAGQGGEVEGRAFVGVVAFDGGVEAGPELLEAGLFVDE